MQVKSGRRGRRMRAELQSDFYQAIVVATVVAMAWLAFTVWTLRWLGRRDGADPPDLRIKIGVRGFGVATWLVCTGMAGYVLLSQFGGAEPWAWGGVAAVSYLTLPLSLWTGFAWAHFNEKILLTRKP